MGANLERIHFVKSVGPKPGVKIKDMKERPFNPATDMGALRDAIIELGDVALIIVDPIVSAVSGDSHKNSETRQGLQPLVDLCQDVKAVLLGITHFTKGTSGREPIERVTGSLAFGAVARVIMVTAVQPVEEEGALPKHVFAIAKCNIGPMSCGFEYELESVDLEGWPDVRCSEVKWGKTVEGTARELLNEAEETGKDDRKAVDRAADFLRETLVDSEMLCSDVKAAAEAQGVSWSAIERAKEKKVSIKSRRDGKSGKWSWKLKQTFTEKDWGNAGI